MFKQLAFIVVFLSVLLSGCATAPLGSPQADAQAKSFAVVPGKSNIYLYRNEVMGFAFGIGVELDGKAVGKTGAKTYLAMEVSPGKHTIVSKAENDETLDVVTEAGKNYFVWQEVKVGLLTPRSKLHLVDDETGKAAVKECNLIEAAK